jgi:2-C-methyl-D-erythritol 4-phosphate cytidylyltransferase
MDKIRNKRQARNIAVILAGGTGSRMGGSIPKQYMEIGGHPVIEYCLKTLLCHPDIDMGIIGVSDEWLSFVKTCVEGIGVQVPVFFAKPGETRQGSIINALQVLKDHGADKMDIVLIHDAARPLLSAKLVSDCLEACKDADAVLPVIPVKDTTYLSYDGKHIDSLLERKTLWNGQAPEAFRFGSYYDANMKLTDEELFRTTGSTEVSYRAGLKCVLIPGDPNNFKITTKEDLSHFETIVKNESL